MHSWFKSNQHNTPIDRNDFKNLCLIIRNFWNNHNHWYIFGNVDYYNHRSSFSNNHRSIIPNWKDKEQASHFFRESQAHSKEIGKIISQGYGRSAIGFGTCKYENGTLKRINPSIPELENIGLAKQHLENGYPELINQRLKVENAIIGIYDEIENTIVEFEKTIIDLIPKTLLSKEAGYFPEIEDFQTFYYSTISWYIYSRKSKPILRVKPVFLQ